MNCDAFWSWGISRYPLFRVPNSTMCSKEPWNLWTEKSLIFINLWVKGVGNPKGPVPYQCLFLGEFACPMSPKNFGQKFCLYLMYFWELTHRRVSFHQRSCLCCDVGGSVTMQWCRDWPLVDSCIADAWCIWCKHNISTHAVCSDPLSYEDPQSFPDQENAHSPRFSTETGFNNEECNFCQSACKWILFPSPK